jgi:hypothetical protein
VINPSDQKLDDALSSLLQKGLNFAVNSCSTPIQDVLAGVEKAVLSLPAEMADEARQETVRIIKYSSRPRDNLRKTERAALKSLKDNVNLTILPADKRNVTVVLNTTDYKHKISSLLEEPAYRKLTKDHTEAIELKTTLLLKKSSLTENTCRQLCPAGSRPLHYMDYPRYTKKEFHLDLLSATLVPPHTIYPSTYQDCSINLLGNQHIMLKTPSTSSKY